MTKNIVRSAWFILLISLTFFCLLAVSIPLGVRWFLLNAEVDDPATLQVTLGTVLLLPQDADEPIAVVDTRAVESSTLIQTDQSSQAIIEFPTGENPQSPLLATVQIYPNAQVGLMRFSKPRYDLSSNPNHIVLEVRNGRVRVNRSDLESNGLLFDVKTPHATAHLGPGSFAVDVTNKATEVASRMGDAYVDGENVRVKVAEGFSTQVATGQPPSTPVEAAENLIVNGDFEEPLGPPSWLVGYYPEEDPSAGQANLETIGERTAVRFRRINQPPTHTEIGITQVLSHNVRDYEELNLQMDVMLRWQSLPGAGEQSSEFPVMVWLDYEDIYGNHQFWTHGFYYRDPPEQWVVTGGEKIPSNLWIPFESGNLLERLPAEGRPPPATINWIKIYASGHNYDSMVSEVRLVAR